VVLAAASAPAAPTAAATATTLLALLTGLLGGLGHGRPAHEGGGRIQIGIRLRLGLRDRLVILPLALGDPVALPLLATLAGLLGLHLHLGEERRIGLEELDLHDLHAGAGRHELLG